MDGFDSESGKIFGDTLWSCMIKEAKDWFYVDVKPEKGYWAW